MYEMFKKELENAVYQKFYESVYTVFSPTSRRSLLLFLKGFAKAPLNVITHTMWKNAVLL